LDACWSYNAEVDYLSWAGRGDCIRKTFSMKKKIEDLQKPELLELKIAMIYILKPAFLPRFM
jgi:hypothetical protein